MSVKFTKAKSEQAFFKAGLYGKTGSGKTLTSLLWAEGLAKREGKRIAYVDTEHGCDFYAQAIKERTVHPAAFDFDVLVTRSIMETIEAIEQLDPNVYGVVVIDSITHLWEAAKAAYTGRLTSKGGIPIQAWSALKKPYKKLMSLFLDGNYHAILCGREGIEMEDDEDGDLKVVGTKMKAEGETPHEPHVLGRMHPERDENGGYIIRVFFEKDRSGVLSGKTFDWPNYDTIAPVVAYLSGSEQAKLGSVEANAEKDAEKVDAQKRKDHDERLALFTQIRDAIRGAKDVEALKVAWSLTKGKKTKLGDEYMNALEAEKDARKAGFMEVVA